MKKSLTIYISKDDGGWLGELRKYAKSNHWSISLTIREILKDFIQCNSPGIKPIKGYQKINIPDESVVEPEIETEKIDPDTYFAQIESKLVKTETNDIDKQMAECIKEKTNSNGEVSCYFFDNAREYFSFCKQYCWTNKKIWGKRVRL